MFYGQLLVFLYHSPLTRRSLTKIFARGGACKYYIYTGASCSISSVSRAACAIIGSLSVITESIGITVMSVSRTLVNIVKGGKKRLKVSLSDFEFLFFCRYFPILFVSCGHSLLNFSRNICSFE